MNQRLLNLLCLTSQLVPVNPSLQLQVYPLIPSTQAASLRQGFGSHSFILISQFLPLYPEEVVVEI